jgi:hypothetical protein
VALTIKEIENAKPKDKKYKLADGGGLCLLIQPWGGNNCVTPSPQCVGFLSMRARR